MSNKSIIGKLKEQVKDLEDNMYSDDDKLRDWVDQTKIYIRGLWLDKKDDNFRKEVINMLEKYKGAIPTYDNLDWYKDMEKAAIAIGKDILKIQYKLENILKSFIEILELREKDLKDEEKQKSKKSDKK